MRVTCVSILLTLLCSVLDQLTVAQQNAVAGGRPGTTDIDGDLTFICHSPKASATARDIILDTIAGTKVTLQKFDHGRATVILVHGLGLQFKTIMLPAYIASELDINLIEVDWQQVIEKYATFPDYSNLLDKLPSIGKYIAHILKELNQKHDYPMTDIEVVADNIAMDIAHHIGQEMNLFGHSIDKIWIMNPEWEAYAKKRPADRLNVNDANLVEVMLIRDNWLGNMGDLALGHLVYYLEERSLDSYRYAARCIREAKAYMAYPCTTIDQAIKGQCSPTATAFMGGEPNRTPSVNKEIYKGKPTQYFWVYKGAPLEEVYDKALDEDVTFKCYSTKQTNSLKTSELTTANNSIVKFDNFDPERRTIFLIHGFGGEFVEAMLNAYMASGYSFNIIVINWTKVATKCRDSPNQHGPRDTLVRKLPDVGRHIAYLLMRLMLDHNYAAFNIELVTDNIGAHIAHEIGKRIILAQKRINKIWALNPESESYTTACDLDRLNYMDASLVEVLLTNTAWLDKLADGSKDKPIGHLIFCSYDNALGMALYKYATDIIRSDKAYPAKYCKTFAEARAASCSGPADVMDCEPRRIPEEGSVIRSLRIYSIAE